MFISFILPHYSLHPLGCFQHFRLLVFSFFSLLLSFLVLLLFFLLHFYFVLPFLFRFYFILSLFLFVLRLYFVFTLFISFYFVFTYFVFPSFLLTSVIPQFAFFLFSSLFNTDPLMIYIHLCLSCHVSFKLPELM